MPCPTKLSFCQRRELLLCALFFVEHMRERVDLKSPVRDYRPPGSVRGAPGNRCPYLDTFNVQRSTFNVQRNVQRSTDPGVSNPPILVWAENSCDNADSGW